MDEREQKFKKLLEEGHIGKINMFLLSEVEPWENARFKAIFRANINTVSQPNQEILSQFFGAKIDSAINSK